MAIHFLRQVRQAIEQLSPDDVRQTAESPVYVRLTAISSASYEAMEDFLIPHQVSRKRRLEIVQSLFRAGDPETPETIHVDIWEDELQAPEGAFQFHPARPELLVEDVLKSKQELGLPLARLFPPFRRPVADRTIFNVSKENTLFTIVTAMPDLAPGLQIPWAIPEAASDAVVLTLNQIRMAFLLAASSDRPVGYREQKAEIAAVIAGAVGWRALARELVGKIPLGGGILPKAGIAFAATYVEGLSLERLYRLGYGLTRAERKLAYGEALARGRQVAAALWEAMKNRGGENSWRRASIDGRGAGPRPARPS